MRDRGASLATLALVTGLAAGGGAWLVEHPAYLHTMGLVGAGVLAAGVAAEVVRESNDDEATRSDHRERGEKGRSRPPVNGTAAPRGGRKAGSATEVPEVTKVIKVRWERDLRRGVMGRYGTHVVFVDKSYSGLQPEPGSTWRARVVHVVESKRLAFVEPLEEVGERRAAEAAAGASSSNGTESPTREAAPAASGRGAEPSPAVKQALAILEQKKAEEARGALDAMAGLEASLNAAIRGQASAIADIAGELRRRYALDARRGPVCSLFFVGPTGVGKTEVAKLVAKELRLHLVRLDMGTFHDRESASRLYGPPPGYIGMEQGGQLTRPVREHPRSLILFDEIEKAHPDVYKTLLSVMDEGILTDASDGRVSEFKESVLVFTSNLATDELGRAAALLGDDRARLNTVLRHVLKDTGRFAPEWVGRVGRVVYFLPLSQEAQLEILEGLVKGVAGNVGVTLDAISHEVLLHLWELLGGAEFGVRGMSSLVEERIIDLLIPYKGRGGHVALEVRDRALLASRVP